MTTPKLLSAIQDHLSEVAQTPSLPLNEKLLEEFQAQFSESTDRASIAELINQLSGVLPSLQQDPTPIVKLISTIIKPATFTFNDVLSIQPSVDFVAGFNTSSAPINLVTLELLMKATYTASDAAIVAGQPGVAMALIQLWLCTPETAVGQKAQEVLWGLLEVDHKRQTQEEHRDLSVRIDGNIERGEGQGLVWRRLFGDRDIYGRLLSICSLQTVGQANQPSKRDKTVAQARLMDLIPKVAKLDWDIISVSHFPDIESYYGVKGGGLVEFAALHMVDVADDLLMHVTLIDFFAELLGVYSSDVLPLSASAGPLLPLRLSSPSLDFLIRQGLHQRTASFYSEPSKHDSIEITYIYSRAANYLAVYAACYPTHLLESSPPFVDSLLSHISQALSLTPNQWARSTGLQHDLHLLASLPRVALIPSSSNAANSIFKVPVKPANAAALRTLATIFNGPDQRLITGDLPPYRSVSPDKDTSASFHREAAAARALYFYYLQRYSAFWSQLVSTAEIIALKENALAAIALMGAIITADWAPLPTEPASNTTSGDSATGTARQFLLPTEQQLQNLQASSIGPLPPSGILAVLASPAVDVVLPYLMRPAQRFNNLVGGMGDVESAAYKVATAKYDLLTLFHQQLGLASEGVDGLQDVVTAAERRLAEGPMGRSSEVGGRVATMEL
ncbi:MAG: hypothetical protein M1830_008333 [Pleopsidium flavum]|nr:MAG: hypothetical protein M1830_008333 [Pleopsidium flavum]